MGLDLLQRLEAVVRRGNLKPAPFELALQELDIDRLIVDHQYSFAGHGALLGG